MEQKFQSVYTLMDTIKKEMVSGSLSNFMSIAILIGGVGCILYIAYRVWRSLANAEPIDLFPLFRPFVMALIIISFDWFMIPVLDGLLQPVTTVFETVGEKDSNDLEAKKEEHKKMLKETKAKKLALTAWERDSGDMSYEEYQKEYLDRLENPKWHDFKAHMWNLEATLTESVQDALMWAANWIFIGARLLIKIMSTFLLIILSLIGPLVFAASCFDGFTSGYINWIGRYINISLWAPLTAILDLVINKLHYNFLEVDIAAMSQPGGASNSIFMIVAFYIIGAMTYMQIPSISSWIVEAGNVSGGVNKAMTGMAAGVGGWAGSQAGQVMSGATGIKSVNPGRAVGGALGKARQYTVQKARDLAKRATRKR